MSDPIAFGEFWKVGSENVPFRKGWFRREFDLQQFMKVVQEDPRGGEIIGMNFDGKNLELYTKASPEQMKEMLDKGKKV